MMMSKPVALAINVGDDQEMGHVKLAESDHLTSFIAAKVSDILLLSVAVICGLMETLGGRWTDYFSPAMFGAEADMLHRSTLGFIITALIAFAEIKSQGQTGFPFQTHPQAIMVSVTSLLIYGLASAAEHVFSAPGTSGKSLPQWLSNNLRSNPQAIKVSITSLLMYGLTSGVQQVIQLHLLVLLLLYAIIAILLAWGRWFQFSF